MKSANGFNTVLLFASKYSRATLFAVIFTTLSIASAGTTCASFVEAVRTSQSLEIGLGIQLETVENGPTLYQSASFGITSAGSDLKPTSLASADFNEDGIADLVVVYSGTPSGLITLGIGDRGNSFRVNDLETTGHREQGMTNRTIFSDEKIYESPDSPDFVLVGDFDCDGHADVVIARRGGNHLYLFAGDGHGSLRSPIGLIVPGNITETISGEVNRADGLPDIVVATESKSGSHIYIFESPIGAFNSDPEIFEFSERVTSLALGRLSTDMFDLALAAQDEVFLIHGRDRKLSLDSTQRSLVPVASIEKRRFGNKVISMAVGDFNDRRNTALALLLSNGEIMALSSSAGSFAHWERRDVEKAHLNSDKLHENSRLLAAHTSAYPGDNLLVVDSSNQIKEIAIENEDAESGIQNQKSHNRTCSINFGASVISVLPLPLNNDAFNDLVVLNADGNLNLVLTEPQDVFVVTNTNDSGPGSLRQAILDSNSNPSASTINFDISGAGIQTITPITPLPQISAPVSIDGTTQPGYNGSPLIEINGSSVIDVNGLQITAPNCTVRGLAINRFYRVLGGGAIRSGYQIYVDITSRNNIISGNIIGTNAAGTAGFPAVSGLVQQGIYLENSPDNVIGGTTAVDRNLISGLDTIAIEMNGVGTTRTLVQGNYIGTDVTGNVPIGNNFYGISVGGPSNTFGGSLPGAGNVISSSRPYGIRIANSDKSGNVIQGNFIGTSADGMTALPNFTSGVFIGGNPNTTIGGTSPNARNVISGNPQYGVEMSPSGVTGILLQGNFVGINSAGTSALPNMMGGISIASGPVNVGGTVSGARNVISGNSGTGANFGYGVGVFGSSMNTFIQGNYIGTRSDGSGAVPNTGSGIYVDGSRDFTIGGTDPGAANVLAYNGRAGVYVALGFDIAISHNSIYSNSGLGIDLAPEGVTPNDLGDTDSGPNLLQNYPSLSDVSSNGRTTTVQGTLNSKSNSVFTLEFFSNTGCDSTSFGEGRTYIGSQTVSTDGIGNAAFNAVLPTGVAGGQFVTATATDLVDNTSEFSACRSVVSISGGVPTIFDFDGDGKTDLSIFRPNGATGSEWWYLKSSNGGNFATQFGSPTDKLVAADYTGDGKADIAFFRPSTGFWYILRSEDSSFYAFPFGANGDIPAPADFDGDGKADAAVFRPSTATWFIQNSGGGTTIQAFGAAGDVPVVGDYDGDGKADIAIFRPNGATGSEWWILRSTAGLIATQFGTPTDKTVPGDYTGDGKTDIAIWRPSNGQWFILRSEDLSFYAFPFGSNGDIPVPGDYDGDGKTDAAVFRPSSSTWFAQGSTAGTIIQQFGSAGDVPVPNEFVR